MPTINEEARAVIEASEWVAIGTAGPDGPHVAGTWGDYVRALGVTGEAILIPAGGLRHTEANIGVDRRVELLFASRQVPGSSGGAGRGCLVRGWGEVQLTGSAADAVRARFPWARAALVVHVQHVSTQL